MERGGKGVIVQFHSSRFNPFVFSFLFPLFYTASLLTSFCRVGKVYIPFFLSSWLLDCPGFLTDWRTNEQA